MHILKKLWLSVFIGKRFYRMIAAVIFLFIISYFIPFLFNISVVILFVFLAILAMDAIVLFSKLNAVSVKRILPERLSNGEENTLYWQIENNYSFAAYLQLFEEFPEAWQIRDVNWKLKLEQGDKKTIQYELRPRERGEFQFGNMHVLIKTSFELIVRRKTFFAEESLKVYPAFLLLRQFEFKAHITDPGNIGFKQVRKTGHSLEFEQIREYVGGDDIRSINWKATGRTGGNLMINVYSDEKSQQIYCIIDKGRTMKMPFDGLTLLDYSVNATLALSAIAISKQDRAGLISFGDMGGEFLPANHRNSQMSGISNALYNINTKFLESDYAFLHKLIKTRITQRSLLILFTNFESLTALQRQLPYLRNISERHLLLVVFFENTSLYSLASGEAKNIEGLYEKVIAEKFILEKKLIIKELQKYGIPALLTAPGKLSVDVVNKYLQIKARREI